MVVCSRNSNNFPGTILSLRFADPALLEAIAELDQQCFGGLWTAAGYQRELDNPHSMLLVLTISPPEYGTSSSGVLVVAIAGFWSILEEAHITLLGVHPNWRGKGLGQLMLLGILNLARQRGLERATLEVRASNQTALSLYQKLGFQPVGQRKQYYPDNGEDGLILWCNHLDSPTYAQLLDHCWQETYKRGQSEGWLLHQQGTDISLS